MRPVRRLSQCGRLRVLNGFDLLEKFIPGIDPNFMELDELVTLLDEETATVLICSCSSTFICCLDVLSTRNQRQVNDRKASHSPLEITEHFLKIALHRDPFDGGLCILD
jgi:hypothetical protein